MSATLVIPPVPSSWEVAALVHSGRKTAFSSRVMVLPGEISMVPNLGSLYEGQC